MTNQHRNKWLLDKSMREIYREVNCQYQPKDIIVDIQNEYKFKISNVRHEE